MSGQDFLDYLKSQAQQQRKDDLPSATLSEWKEHRVELRERLISSWGGLPTEHCDLNPQVVGSFNREGYRVEKVLLQTRPEIWMTANAYIPEGKGTHPAVLCVHGHWRLGKSQPEMQARCIGLAKLGFFVLMVDAVGAGERGIEKALGEYHGEMVAATLWPSGLSLPGLQVYENMRAVDYIQSRPEVDPERIGVTGASGGGNQTMYVGAVDARLKCVVPVCSVGTYQAYLGAACCLCEVTPGALSFTEEGAVLGLVAPRALMLINATRDAFQFSVAEGAKSLAFAKEIFALYGKSEKATQAVFESGHGYHQPMREKMYGWMSLHLKSEGDGSSIPEPEQTPEEVETLRCFPGDSRSDDYITLPQFAAAQARILTSRISVPTHLEQWQSQEASLCMGLSDLLGPFPKRLDLNLKSSKQTGIQTLEFDAEPGVRLTAKQVNGKQTDGTNHRVILLDLEQGVNAIDSEWATVFRNLNATVVALDLRATGTQSWKSDKVKRAPDHNTAEWSVWMGKPLVGQWIWDISQLLDALDADDIINQKGRENITTTVVGSGPAGLVAILAASLTTRIQRVATIGSMATYVSELPYEGQRLGTIVPGILREVGDIPHIAATLSPRRLVINQPVSPQNKPLTNLMRDQLFRPVSAAYELEHAANEFILTNETTPEAVAARILN